MARKKISPQKFDRLKEQANDFHIQATTSFTKARDRWKHGLECAAKCGEALLEIKRCLPWGKFKKWTNESFDGRSYNTASDYMRVATAFKKNDPRLEEARKAGKVINSINSVKEALRKPRPQKNDDSQCDDDKTVENTEANEASMCRQGLREKFAKALRDLDKEELLVFEDAFDCYWEKLSIKLNDDTCAVLGFDLDEYYLEQEQDLLNWTPKNKSRRASMNIPQKVVNAHLREQRVAERIENKEKARYKVKQALNRKTQ